MYEVENVFTDFLSSSLSIDFRFVISSHSNYFPNRIVGYANFKKIEIIIDISGIVLLSIVDGERFEERFQLEHDLNDEKCFTDTINFVKNVINHG